MTRGPVVRVDGLNKLVRNLTICGVEAADLKAAMRKGSDILADGLRETTPVKTGLLASTIRPGTAKGRATARIGGKRPKHYAPFPNYGTSTQPAQKFAQRAAEKSRVPAILAIEADLQRIITKYNLD